MEHILVIRTHTIEKGQETKIDVVFDSYPEIDKTAIKWNILHTNFKGSDWKFSRAKNDDVRQRLNYDKMVENKVFRITKDIDISDQTHSLELFVSAGYHYDEYDAVGDELWLVEMVVMVSNGNTYFCTNHHKNWLANFIVRLRYVTIFS